MHETVCKEVRHGGPQPTILVIGAFFLLLAIATTRLGLSILFAAAMVAFNSKC